MIYYDLKVFLQGYVEYLSFTYGVDFKLQRDKKLNQFEISVRDSNNKVSNYKTLMYCETGDLKEKCMIRVRYLYDASIFDKLDDFNYDSAYYGYPGFEIRVKITQQEELQKLLNILEEVDFFNKWR